MPRNKSIKTAKNKLIEAIKHYQEAWQKLPIEQRKNEGMILHYVTKSTKEGVHTQIVTFARHDLAMYLTRKLIKSFENKK